MGIEQNQIPNRVRKLIQETKLERAEFDRRISVRRAESDRIQEQFRRETLPRLREASASDYTNWLVRYMQQGSDPTHVYDYSFDRAKDAFYVAHSDFQMVPLFGAQAIRVIVPDGVNFTGGDLGHSTLYFADGRIGGLKWVPVYNELINTKRE